MFNEIRNKALAVMIVVFIHGFASAQIPGAVDWVDFEGIAASKRCLDAGITGDEALGACSFDLKWQISDSGLALKDTIVGTSSIVKNTLLFVNVRLEPIPVSGKKIFRVGKYCAATSYESEVDTQKNDGWAYHLNVLKLQSYYMCDESGEQIHIN